MCLFPRKLKFSCESGYYTMEVPCGKCIECLHTRISDWCYRIKIEDSFSKHSLFVTLTYSDEFVPANGLEVTDLQKHFKRLRKRLTSVRYYALGEYGTNTERPHYHYILFSNDDIKYREFYSIVNESWTKGFIYIKPLTQGRIVYCVSYLLALHTPEGKNKPFTCMSKRPAIGFQALDNPQFVKQITDNKFSYVYSNGHKVHCPRYYKRKLSNERYSLIDYYLLNCFNCCKEYKQRKEYLKKFPYKVSDPVAFLDPHQRFLYSNDVIVYSKYIHDTNVHKDYIVKQRNKKTRIL